eukprot:s636_g18.t1
MFEARKLIRLPKTDYLQKTYVLYMYVHTCLRRRTAAQALLVSDVEHPSKTEQSQREWMHGLIAFLIEHVFPVGRHGKHDMIKKFLGGDVFGDVSSKSQAAEADELGVVDVCEGASQESLMPEVDMSLDTAVYDVAGGASQASVLSDIMPEIGRLPGESQAAMVARENTLVAEVNNSDTGNGVSQELMLHLEEAMDLDSGEQNVRLEQARKRRLLPGADTTMDNFQSFFGGLLEVAERGLADVPQLAYEDEPSIPQKVSRVRANVARKFPRLDEALIRLVTGAVTVYRLWLTDLNLRELVMLLWIIEGERHMRCHEGNLYFFNLGAFALHKGAPPQGTLARCKRFFMQLEGLFRLLGAAQLKTNDDVLDQVEQLLDDNNNSAQQLLFACEDAASGHIPAAGTARRARGSRNEPNADADDEVAAAPAAGGEGRCKGLADALTKAGFTMQNELLRDRIFNLVVEWCDSPQLRKPGISYTDCAFLYAAVPGQHVTPTRGVPEDNIYVHIPHPDDPVLAAARSGLVKFYSETFWLNNEATWKSECMFCFWIATSVLY